MSQNFDDVPVDKDARILFRHPAKLGKYDILYEMWSWEGIKAESVIFATVEFLEMRDKELEQEMRQSPLVKKWVSRDNKKIGGRIYICEF